MQGHLIGAEHGIGRARNLRRLRWGEGTQEWGEGAREWPPRAACRGRRGLSSYRINAVLANPYANAVIRVHAVIRPCKFGEPGG